MPNSWPAAITPLVRERSCVQSAPAAPDSWLAAVPHFISHRSSLLGIRRPRPWHLARSLAREGTSPCRGCELRPCACLSQPGRGGIGIVDLGHGRPQGLGLRSIPFPHRRALTSPLPPRELPTLGQASCPAPNLRPACPLARFA